ncbi:sensor domain-containing protein [Embleya sp. NPDC020630]|uniref:sensor domain-containing protein n=1 Tax=Embleya sp. NPDC020630 TaxID=3363979 RepID=UPI0037B536DD
MCDRRGGLLGPSRASRADGDPGRRALGRRSRAQAGGSGHRSRAAAARVPPADRHRDQGMVAALRETQSWRDLTHMVAAFPLRVVSFRIALTWTVGGVGEVLYALWSWPIPRDPGNAGLLDLMFGVLASGRHRIQHRRRCATPGHGRPGTARARRAAGRSRPRV